jgi:RNA polymerase sigma factor (sigma-70 family)
VTGSKTTGMAGLAAALADDRHAAFPHLVGALQDEVYSGALRLTGSRADAEEITQEAFVRAYRALGTYPPERVRELQVRAWVWTITLNLCRNRARSRQRRPETPWDDRIALPDPAPGPEQEALATTERERLADHLTRLPWTTRAAVVLRHVAGLSYAEVSAALGRPVGTVKSDVHRGLQRLRESLEEEA